MRALPATVAAAVLATATVAGTSGAGGGAEQLYYGRTSGGRAASIDLVGGRLGGTSGLAYQQRSFLMNRFDEQQPLPGGLRFVGGAAHFHTVVHGVNNMRGEFWFDARRSADGRTVKGTYRELATVEGHNRTTTLPFSTVLWAASAGVAWSGKAADGTPLAAAVKVLPSPAGDPRYSISVPTLTVPLDCNGAPTQATATGLQAPLATLRGDFAPPTHGEYMFTNGLATASPARADGTTGDGGAARVTFALTRLRWQGAGFVATGTVTASGSGCTTHRTSFSLRPTGGA